MYIDLSISFNYYEGILDRSYQTPESSLHYNIKIALAFQNQNKYMEWSTRTAGKFIYHWTCGVVFLCDSVSSTAGPPKCPVSLLQVTLAQHHLV
jgi:hypothetical protein